MNVREIVKEWLDSHGYDGLYDGGECFCFKDSEDYEFMEFCSNLEQCRPGRELVNLKFTGDIAERPYVIGLRHAMPRTPLVHDIVKDFIELHGFDGLYDLIGCGCDAGTLMHCNIGCQECRAGYRMMDQDTGKPIFSPKKG